MTTTPFTNETHGHDAERAAELRARWRELERNRPGLRIRNAAAALGVSEAALLATGVGDDAVRLDGDFGELIRELPGLGPVKCITRNELAVHEKIGRFDHVSIGPGHGMVLNRQIDLRLFLSHWHHGFAVTERSRRGERRSLQFFDSAGSSVHKVYLVEDTDRQRYTDLVERYRAAHQTTRFEALAPASTATVPDDAVDRELLRRHWLQLKDTHDFVALLRDFGVQREQALRLAGEDLARRVPVASFRSALEQASSANVSIMVFVGNPGCIQIHTGPIERVVDAAGWLNVLDPDFDLHVRESELGAVWIVRKPTRDGVVTSVELFDHAGANLLMMFGERKPGQRERDEWRELVAGLEAQAVAA